MVFEKVNAWEEVAVVVLAIALLIVWAVILFRGQQRTLANRALRVEHEHERLMAVHRPGELDEQPARRRDAGATITSREPRLAVHLPGVGA